jgi:hypothetical protein
LGRTFELDVLQRLSELDEDGIVGGLDSAVRAHVVEEVAGAAGRYTFSHALIRDIVYGGLTATRRALLHRRAGTALEQAHDAHIEPYLAEIAYHFAQAGFIGDLDTAIEYGTRAGKHAISQLAYEQAAAHFRQTIELIGSADPSQRPLQRCDLVIAQGEAERQAGDRAYRQTLLNAARLAGDLHDPDRLARAALANNCGFFSSAAGVDRERVAVLQTALSSYDSTDSPTRAALLGLLALELGSDENWRLRDKLSDEAIAMARRGGDPQTLARVLIQSCLAKLRPQMGPELHANLRPTRSAVHALVRRHRASEALRDQRTCRRGRASCLRRPADRATSGPARQPAVVFDAALHDPLPTGRAGSRRSAPARPSRNPDADAGHHSQSHAAAPIPRWDQRCSL